MRRSAGTPWQRGTRNNDIERSGKVHAELTQGGDGEKRFGAGGTAALKNGYVRRGKGWGYSRGGPHTADGKMATPVCAD